MADDPTPDRKALEAFLDEQTARDELDTLERAIGWTVRSVDLEFPDSVHCFGFWEDPLDAMRAAEFHREEVNRDNSPESLGWAVTVQALLPFTGSAFPRQPGGIVEREAPVPNRYGVGASESDAAMMLGGVVLSILVVGVLAGLVALWLA